MAINPPSDLVLGAVLAADPAKYRAAAERLQRARASAGEWSAVTSPAPQSNASPYSDVQSGPDSKPAAAPAATSNSSPPWAATQTASRAVPRTAGKTPDAFAQLEAFVLQSFIQTMLPSSGSSQTFFGKGTAGEVWKSMLAEKLGAELARSGQVGLAKRLAAGRTVAGEAGSFSGAALGGISRTSPSLLSALTDLQDATSVESSERS
ncbi:MAG: rod-binding protein [Hyphomicrobiaceae bacterium]